MERLFGRIIQVSYFVEDVEANMAAWSKATGIGPWNYEKEFKLENYKVNGEPVEGPVISIALTYINDVQVEFIQLRESNGLSLFDRYQEKRQFGLHHWASYVSDFDASTAQALKHGWTVAHEGDTIRGRFSYISPPSGFLIELQEKTPKRDALWATLEKRSADWDGVNHIYKG